MLDNLDQVRWEDLSHAYGQADDVPDLLCGLASSDSETREGALYALYGNIWHQGTVYEATAHAVPFLLGLLTVPSDADKAGILGLLRAVSKGTSFHDVHQRLELYRTERKTVEFQEQRLRELEWVRAARAAVVAGVPVYLSLLADPEVLEAVRAMAAFVLAACPERWQEIEPALLRRVAVETFSVAKASVLLALAELTKVQARATSEGAAEAGKAGEATEIVVVLQSAMDDRATSPVVRFAAAIGFLLLAGADTSVDGLDEVDVALPVLNETVFACKEDYRRLPWASEVFGDTPVGAASAVLAPRPTMCLNWLLSMLENDDAETRRDAIHEIRDLCREQRFATREAVVPVAQRVGDEDNGVRSQAAYVLPTLGAARQEAVPVLQALQEEARSEEVRLLAEKVLAEVQAPRDKYALEKWLKPPKVARSLAECLAVLQGIDPSKAFERSDAATALELMRPPAVEAVPALRGVLGDDLHWVRVHAARALWKITGDASLSLPTLMGEMQCRPAGLLVLDCLGDMGRAAEAAVPALHQIIESPVRLGEFRSDSDSIDQDEAFCAAAQRALERIQAS